MPCGPHLRQPEYPVKGQLASFRASIRERIYIQDRRQCILWPNLGSDMPIFLPYSTDHSDQSRYNVKWNTFVNSEVGLSVAILEAGYHRHYLHCWQGQLFTEQEYPVCSRMFSSPTHPISVSHHMEWNDNHRGNEKFLWHFPKSFHWEIVSETGASLIFKSFLLKESLWT